MNQHEHVVAEVFMQVAHLFYDAAYWLDAVAALPERRSGAERAGKWTAASGFNVDGSFARTIWNGCRVIFQVQDSFQIAPGWVYPIEIEQGAVRIEANGAGGPIAQARYVLNRSARI